MEPISKGPENATRFGIELDAEKKNHSRHERQGRQSVGNVSATFGKAYGTLRVNTLSDIVAAGFDAGIRLRHALHRDMVAVPLGPLQRSVTIDVEGHLAFDEMRAVLDAATRDCGLAYVFEQFAQQELASGALVPLLEKFSPPSEAFHVYYPARTMMPGKLRAFLDFMRAANRS